MAVCTPSRLNFEGDPSAANPLQGTYGGGYGDVFGWRDLLREWRARDDFAGLELRAVRRVLTSPTPNRGEPCRRTRRESWS